MTIQNERFDRFRLFRVLLPIALLTAPMLSAQSQPDPEIGKLLDADHFHWTPPSSETLTREWWEHRRTDLREKLLVTAGLVPEPVRSPLNAKVFGEVSGDGFTVSKVYFESLPGFLVTGNLYRPTLGKGPYPAILTPHGHWQYGRLQNTADGSIPARCIDFARQGYVVFSYDMIGYNDSFQLPHDNNKSRAQLDADQPLPYEPRLFRGAFDFAVPRLYGLSLGGLQLWDSIRALDFVTSLDDVDPERIGVTGASGGATQTILVMVADDRVKVAAPVNIIGMEKHPGCGCENISNLWVGTSTLEMAAVFAPKPLLMVSATQDPWTNSTPTREYPTMERYYRLYGAESKLANHNVNAGHNFNPESRAAVYDWFRKVLNPPGPAVTSPPPVATEMASLGDLRVFPDHLLPDSAKSSDQILADWEAASEKSLSETWPTSGGGLADFSKRFSSHLARLLSVDRPVDGALDYSTELEEARGDIIYRRERITQSGGSNPIRLESVHTSSEPSGAVLLVYPESFGPLASAGEIKSALPLIPTLVERGLEVYHARGFASDERSIPDRDWQAMSWPDAYNRDNHLRSVQEIVTALASIRDIYPDKPVTVIGLESKGIEAAFAAAVSGLADRVIVDLDGEDPEVSLTLDRLFPVAGLKRIGDFRTAVLLLCNHKVTLLNPAKSFPSDSYQKRALQAGKGNNLTIHPEMATTDANFIRVLTD